MNTNLATIEGVQAAETIIREHLSRVPLMRSYRLEKELGLSPGRRVWLKDYGWTPVGSFKVFGALNWVAKNFDRIGDQPIAAHSSGNFASGISFAGNRYGKRVIIVMPDTAPKVKFDLTRSYGAEIRTYDIARDHATGERNQLVNEIVDHEGGIQASPYDDNDVIAGNGVGGLEIVDELRRNDREISQFICQVSGGGLIAGHALAIANGFPQAEIIGVEPDTAADFHQSLAAGNIVRIDQPSGICDGLLSYDVGAHNWPILKRYVSSAVAVPDTDTRRAMSWLYDHHGLRTEPSGAITTAALLTGRVQPTGDGDIVVVISGRNVDDGQFQKWIA